MDFWVVCYILDDGSTGSATVAAVNQLMAYDMMEQIAAEQQWTITQMYAYKLKSKEAKDDKE